MKYSKEQLQNRLLPLLSRQDLVATKDQQRWAKEMLVSVQDSLKKVFPLRANERAFLDALLNHGEIQPELLTDDIVFQERVKLHPAIQWTAYNVKRN